MPNATPAAQCPMPNAPIAISTQGVDQIVDKNAAQCTPADFDAELLHTSAQQLRLKAHLVSRQLTLLSRQLSDFQSLSYAYLINAISTRSVDGIANMPAPAPNNSNIIVREF